MVAGSEALRDLDFRDNHIGEAGAKEFMAALEERIAGEEGTERDACEDACEDATHG